MLAGQNQDLSSERNGWFVPTGLRAWRGTGETLRGFPAPAGNPHGVRPRNASLRRNAGHNPQFLRKNGDMIFPGTDWRSAIHPGPDGLGWTSPSPQEPSGLGWILPADGSARRPASAGHATQRLQLVPGKIFHSCERSPAIGHSQPVSSETSDLAFSVQQTRTLPAG